MFYINNKKGDYKIFLRKNSSRVERFAASELRCYLEKITGSKFPIIENLSYNAGRSLLIVAEDINESDHNNINKNIKKAIKLKEDGFLIQTNRNGIYWHSKNQRGLLFGVYYFLEKYLRIHWVHPGPKGEVILPQNRINIENINDIEEPDFKIRAMCLLNQLPDVDPEILIDWLAKNRMNRFYIQATAWERLKENIISEIKKRGLEIEVSFRSVQYWLPVTLYKDHPEYFALYKGKRECYDYSLRCASNKEGVRLYAENALRWIEENPEVDVIHIIIQDAYLGRECQCEKCRKKSPIQQIFTFYNAVVDLLNKKGIDKKIDYRIFFDYYEPEQDIIYNKSNFIYDTYYRCACHSIGEKCDKEIDDQMKLSHQPSFPEMPVNIFEAEMLKKWRKAIKKDLIVFENMARENHQNPEPVYQAIERDLIFYHEHKIDGVIVQSNLHSWFCDAPVNYLYARLLWNVNLKQSNVLKEYCELSYNGASSAMYRYFTFLEKEYTKMHGRGYGKAIEGRVNGFLRKLFSDMSEASLRKAGLLLDMATKIADTPDARYRISKDKIILEYGKLAKRLKSAYEKAWSERVNGNFNEAKKFTDEFIDILLDIADFTRVNMDKGAFDTARILLLSLRAFLRPALHTPAYLKYTDRETEEFLKKIYKEEKYKDHILSYSSRSITEWQMEREKQGMGPGGIFGEFMYRICEAYKLLSSLKGKVYFDRELL